jgi:hypothetical protein
VLGIVIPAWNARATFRREVESVRAQSFTSFELLIVDHRSKYCTIAFAPRFPMLSMRPLASAAPVPLKRPVLGTSRSGSAG